MKQFIAAAQILRDYSHEPWNLREGVHITVSRQAMEAIIGRAILDQEFRLALFADPELALVEYDLTEAEIAALKRLDAETLDACASRIGRHVFAQPGT